MSKIAVVVGVFSSGSSNTGIANALEDIGYATKRIPYRDLSKSIGTDATAWSVVNVAEFFKPDFMLFCKFNGFRGIVAEECGKYADKTCLWYMDSMETLKSCPEVLETAKSVDLSVCWPGVADEFTRLGVSNCHGLVEGCDEKEFFPVKPLRKYNADVSFIGTKNEYRDSFIEALKKAGLKVRCYGSGYDEYVTGEIFNTVCCSSKMVLNIGTYNNFQGYFSDRIARTLATKSLSLTHYVPGMERYYVNREHLLMFSSVDECVDLAVEYCNDDNKRESVVKSGYELFMENYTCKHFVSKILEYA